MYSSGIEENSNQQNVYKSEEKYFKQLKQFDSIKGLVTLKESIETLSYYGIGKRMVQTNDGKELELFEFSFPEGFMVIKGYLSSKTQVELAATALNEFVGSLKRETA